MPYNDTNINELLATINLAKYSYEVFDFLSDEENKKKYRSILDEYADFFNVAVRAHLLTAIVSLYKLYDTQKNTTTLIGFRNYVDTELNIDNGDKVTIDEMIKEAKNIWKKVGFLRNRVYAHKNLGKSVAQLFEEIKLKPEEIVRLIELNKEIFNKLKFIVKKSGKIELGLSPKVALEDLMDKLMNK